MIFTGCRAISFLSVKVNFFFPFKMVKVGSFGRAGSTAPAPYGLPLEADGEGVALVAAEAAAENAIVRTVSPNIPENSFRLIAKFPISARRAQLVEVMIELFPQVWQV